MEYKHIKHLFVPVVFFLVWIGECNAQTAKIMFHIKDWDKSDTTRMVASMWYSGTGLFPTKFDDDYKSKILLPISRNGIFYLTVDNIKRPIRLFGVIRNANDREKESINATSAFTEGPNSFLIVNPGDSVSVTLNKTTPKSEYLRGYHRFETDFRGRGHNRYKCWDLINAVPLDSIYFSTKIERLPMFLNASINEQIKILERFKVDLTDAEYQMIKTEIIIRSKLAAVNRFDFGAILQENGSSPLTYERFETNKRTFNDIISYPEPEKYELSAFQYPTYKMHATFLHFLYSKQYEEYKASFKTTTFDSIFSFIKRNVHGKNRDILITYLFTNTSYQKFYRYSSDSSFKQYLIEGYSLIEDQNLKDIIRHLIENSMQGVSAYNFSLLKDSTGQQAKLSDFKGKVVLLDMWADYCTGCYLFAKAFHESVYPVFKDNKDFKVISVMLNATSSKFMEKIRFISGPKYTFPEYTNLCSLQNDPENAKILEGYNILSFPTIYLIGKNGNIFSSNIPFFIDKESPNVQKLTNLINQALAE